MWLVFLNRFHQWPENEERRYPCVALKRNTWNDYGFETLFEAELRRGDDEASWSKLGGVKIGRKGYATSDPAIRTILSGVVGSLEEGWFSLGQAKGYYAQLAEEPDQLQKAFARSMRDIPMLQMPLDELEGEDVYRISLLRSSRALEALDFAHKMFGVAAVLTDSFEFRTRISPAGDHVVPFDFSPQNGMPHRLNILVGVNGVGKTQLMARLAVALSRFEEEDAAQAREARGESFEEAGTLTPRPSFYGVVAISFSAFDDFAIPTAADTSKLRYAYCGIRRPEGGLLDENELTRRIPRLIRKMNAEQADLFRKSLDILMPRLAGEPPSGPSYRGLSAGQRIVLNIVCDLILNLGQRSLVLFDEPETHLHPQLVTSLMTVMNVLLESLDCFAIVATHSPIVVQQVLASRVHVVQRIEPGPPIVSNPPSETFGENLSEIVRLVFDAVESDRNYQDVLDELLEKNGGDPDRVTALFPAGLGLNAGLYLDSLRRSD